MNKKNKNTAQAEGESGGVDQERPTFDIRKDFATEPGPPPATKASETGNVRKEEAITADNSYNDLVEEQNPDVDIKGKDTNKQGGLKNPPDGGL